MLLDNPFVSDTRVEKEVNTLSNNFDANIFIYAMHDENLSVIRKHPNCITKRILPKLLKNPFKKKYHIVLSKTAMSIAKQGFDIIHCHDYHMLFLGAEVKKINPKVKLIYDAHEYLKGWPLYLSNKGLFNKTKGYLVRLKELYLEMKSSKYVDTFITVSEPIAKKMKQNFKLQKSPIVISNYPKKNIDEISLSDKTKLNIKNGNNIVIHSGSIYLNNQQLFNALKIFKSHYCSIVFIGNRPRFYEIQELIESHEDYGSIVHFVDFPNKYNELNSILKLGDIGWMYVRNKWDSHRLGSANRFIEYSHAGLAILSTRQETAIKINKKYNHALFHDENDWEKFDENLSQLINEIEVFKKNARTTWVDLNWENEEKKLVILYNELMKNA